MHPLPLKKHKEPLHGDRLTTERAMLSLTGAGKALRAESELVLLLSLVKSFPSLIESSPHTVAHCELRPPQQRNGLERLSRPV